MRSLPEWQPCNKLKILRSEIITLHCSTNRLASSCNPSCRQVCSFWKLEKFIFKQVKPKGAKNAFFSQSIIVSYTVSEKQLHQGIDFLQKKLKPWLENDFHNRCSPSAGILSFFTAGQKQVFSSIILFKYFIKGTQVSYSPLRAPTYPESIFFYF